MKFRSWFLPEEPDVVGYLRAQIAITLEGIEAFERWARGDAAAAEEINALEPRGDAKKRELMEELRAAFVVPLEPEDIFTLSRGIDWVLDGLVDLIAESGVLARGPEDGIAETAVFMREGMEHLDLAISNLGTDEEAATAEAEAAIEAVRKLEDAYYRGMAAILYEEDRGARIAHRELYRRCSAIGGVIVDTAERVMYAVVKQS